MYFQLTLLITGIHMDMIVPIILLCLRHECLFLSIFDYYLKFSCFSRILSIIIISAFCLLVVLAHIITEKVKD